MIDVEDLVDLVKNYNPSSNAEKIRAAYVFGKSMHEGQSRSSSVHRRILFGSGMGGLEPKLFPQPR